MMAHTNFDTSKLEEAQKQLQEKMDEIQNIPGIDVKMLIKGLMGNNPLINALSGEENTEPIIPMNPPQKEPISSRRERMMKGELGSVQNKKLQIAKEEQALKKESYEDPFVEDVEEQVADQLDIPESVNFSDKREVLTKFIHCFLKNDYNITDYGVDLKIEFNVFVTKYTIRTDFQKKHVTVTHSVVHGTSQDRYAQKLFQQWLQDTICIMLESPV